MRIAIIPENESVQLVRDDEYSKDFNGFRRSGRRDVALMAKEMEIDILLSAGFPVGSYQAMLRLLDIENADWELVINMMELQHPGTARKALEFVERLRIYERDGIAIVYMVVYNGLIATVYLGALCVVEGDIPDLLWKMLWLRP
jgi:hypothetical protein